MLPAPFLSGSHEPFDGTVGISGTSSASIMARWSVDEKAASGGSAVACSGEERTKGPIIFGRAGMFVPHARTSKRVTSDEATSI